VRVSGSVENPRRDGWTIAAAEDLLRSLKGVVSARIIAKPGGKVEEIHMLTTSDVNPKQTVRNVESALLAHFDLSVDHRCISVAESSDFGLPRAVEEEGAPPEPTSPARSRPRSPRLQNSRPVRPQPGRLATAPAQDQMEEDDAFFSIPPAHAEVPPNHVRPSPPPRPYAAPESDERILFHGHRTESHRARRLRMVVTLEWLGEIYEGEAMGADLPRGRLETVASATLRAIENLVASVADERHVPVLALEGAKIVDAFDRSYALVAVHAMTDRDVASLAGSADVADSPERAVILATLQAADRWVRGRIQL
jgi:hypothetical protein